MQKRIAAHLLDVGKEKVWFNPEKLAEIKEAITKGDIRGLIAQKIILAKPVVSTSRARIRKRQIQKRKGLRKGHGKRKGTQKARLAKKETWMLKIRAQRNLLKELKENGNITKKIFRDFYIKSKGGFFRSRRHIKLYLDEKGLYTKNAIQKKKTGKN